jgi:hypothetical protein
MEMENQANNVEELIKRLPRGYETACYEKKAMERSREIKTPAELIKLVLLYLTGGYSQLEMSVIAEELGIAKMGDTGFLKKFAKCGDWLAWIVNSIRPSAVIEYPVSNWLKKYTVVALDGSDVTEKGRSGRIFRLHYAFDMMRMKSLSYKITPQKIGETLLNFAVKKDWLILADRVYGTLQGIEHCLVNEAAFILRLRHNAFKMYHKDGTEINLPNELSGVTSETAKEIEAYVKLPSLGVTKLRVCVSKIPEEKLAQVERRNKRRASRKQLTISDSAIEMSKYMVVITALPDTVTATEVLSLYRLRWQVEMYFKRLKSILDFGNVPLRREDSIMTWLNGKLLVSLLIEQILSEVSFSPGQRENPQHLERD